MWRIWVCLLGYSKAGITWALYYLSQTENMSKTVERVWLVRPSTYLAFSICKHSTSDTMRWLPGLSVPDSIHFLSISLHAFFMLSIKNAPRWLVKGRWEWRLGFFKDPSQLFKARFDSENGRRLISHVEVFEGRKCNVGCSVELSSQLTCLFKVKQDLSPTISILHLN